MQAAQDRLWWHSHVLMFTSGLVHAPDDDDHILTHASNVKGKHRGELACSVTENSKACDIYQPTLS